jgi:hypothetical protein
MTPVMSTALSGLLIFLALQVTFVGVLLGMAKWERLAEPQRVRTDEDRAGLELEGSSGPVEADAA